MLSIYIFLLVVLLLWTFFLTSISLCLSRLGPTLSKEAVRASNFFYIPLHRFLFKKKQFDLLIFTTALSANFARILFAGLGLFTLLLTALSWVEILVGALILLIAVLTIGDFLANYISAKWPSSILRLFAVISSFFLLISLPFLFLFIKIYEFFIKKNAVEEPLEETKEAIVSILLETEFQGKLNASDKKLLESVINFKEVIVREVMIPRVDLFSLPATTSIRDAAYTLAKEGYSRVPVYRGSIDNCIGVLMFKDILEIYMQCERQDKPWGFLNNAIETVVKSVLYTPETTKASSLLQELRTKQTHLAIVIDEYGGTAGVVTIEDILEAIVGDISDEYDVEEEVLYTPQSGGGSWIVDARMNLKDAEDTFGIQIPQDSDYETIGGYIFHKLGTVPEQGSMIHETDFDLEILSSTERSVEKVRITPKRVLNNDNEES